MGKNVRKTHGPWDVEAFVLAPLIFFGGGYHPKTPFVAAFRAAHPSNTIPVLSSC